MSNIENKSDEVIRNFDSDTLRDSNLRSAIILQKDMTGADVLDAYLNGVHTIPIDLNKETKMIYRVIERKTNLYRNQFTYWDNKVLYCGINNTQARVAYLSSKPYDYNNGFGETASETVIEEFESYSKDVRSEEVISSENIDEEAVRKTISEIKEFTCSDTVAISYVRLSKKDNDLNVEIKVGDDWISVIKDEYKKDFIHIVTVADLSEINKKFRM